MATAADNAPLYIDALYSACEVLRATQPDMAVLDATRINRVLAEHKAGYEIQGDNFVATGHQKPIAVPERPPSLDAQAHALIQSALEASDRELAVGRGRQAVQEVLWLL